MPRAAITNLTAGILSDKMLGRADLARFQNGCLRLENYKVDPTGEWGARQALVFCGRRKHSDKKSRSIPFKFGVTQAYVIEAGHLYMRFNKDGGLILDGEGGPIYEIETPYSEADLASLWWVQSADVLYLLHENHEPRQLIRRDHDDWTLSLFETSDGPFLKENTDSTKTLTASGTSGTVTVTATGFTPFTDRERSLIRWPQGSNNWVSLRVTAVTDNATVTAEVLNGATLAGTTVSNFRLSVFHKGRWPTTGRLMDGRFLLGGSANALDRTDGSANSDYPNFSPGTAMDAEAFSWTLANDQVDRIMSYASAGELIVLTAGSLWRLSGQTERSAITPNGVSAKKLSGHGASHVPPIEATDAIVWIDRSTRKLLRLQLAPDGVSGYAVNDLTVLSSDISGRRRGASGFVVLGWQPAPTPTIWALRADGVLDGLTYMPEEKVSAWWLLRTADGDEIEDLCVLPNATGNYELHVFVKRMIAGEWVRTYERLEWDDLLRSPAEEKRLDCCLTLDEPVAAALTFDALSGSDVPVVADADAFAPGDVGREIRACLEDGEEEDGEVIWRWIVARIVSVESARRVRVKILSSPRERLLAAGTWRLTVTEVSGLDLFEGELVSAQIDGMPKHNLRVVNGKVQLGQRGSIVHIGRRYRARGLTMPVDVGSPPGTGAGRKGRVDRVMLRVRSSIGGKVAAWRKGHTTRYARQGLPRWDWPAGKPSLPASGDVTLNVTGGWTSRPMVLFEQDEPLPFNLQLLNPNVYAPWVEV